MTTDTLFQMPGDDPINPAHYAGTACADIGELLTANGYQVLKYNWRLGKKGDALVDLKKSFWYHKRELLLPLRVHPMPLGPDPKWVDARISTQDKWVQFVASMLLQWTFEANRFALNDLGEAIETRIMNYGN